MAKFASLWVGDMTRLERLSINSFIKNGHEHHIYLYDMNNAKGLPKEAIIHNANEIIPESEIFKDITVGEYFQFADLFRIKLLSKNDYIWTDLDTVCLSKNWEWNTMFLCPFEPRENEFEGNLTLNNSLFYIKPNTVFMQQLVDAVDGFDYKKTKDPYRLSPFLFTELFIKNPTNYNQVKKHIQPWQVTFPIHYWDIWKIYQKENLEWCNAKCANSFAIHLWRNSLKEILDHIPEKGSWLYNTYQKYLPFKNTEEWMLI